MFQTIVIIILLGIIVYLIFDKKGIKSDDVKSFLKNAETKTKEKASASFEKVRDSFNTAREEVKIQNEEKMKMEAGKKGQEQQQTFQQEENIENLPSVIETSNNGNESVNDSSKIEEVSSSQEKFDKKEDSTNQAEQNQDDTRIILRAMIAFFVWTVLGVVAFVCLQGTNIEWVGIVLGLVMGITAVIAKASDESRTRRAAIAFRLWFVLGVIAYICISVISYSYEEFAWVGIVFGTIMGITTAISKNKILPVILLMIIIGFVSIIVTPFIMLNYDGEFATEKLKYDEGFCLLIDYKDSDSGSAEGYVIRDIPFTELFSKELRRARYKYDTKEAKKGFDYKNSWNDWQQDWLDSDDDSVYIAGNGSYFPIDKSEIFGSK